jgi:hypothetical protein
MDPISNVDGLALLLRQRLAERARLDSGKTESLQRNVKPVGPDALHALAAIRGVDERQLRRTLVQSLLVDQFGAELLNDAKFQQVVDRVTEALESHPATAGLLSRMILELRASVRG